MSGKRNKIKGPMETISLVSPRVKQKLRLEIDEKQINGDLKMVMEQRSWISLVGAFEDWGMTERSKKPKKNSPNT